MKRIKQLLTDSEFRRDFIALIVIVVCLFLVAMGRDSIITAILLTVTGYYFGRRSVTKKKKYSYMIILFLTAVLISIIGSYDKITSINAIAGAVGFNIGKLKLI